MAEPQPSRRGPSSFPLDPQTFDADERISFSTLDKKFLIVDDNGDEYEFDEALKRWVPIIDEELAAQQAAAYKIAGVDEEETVEQIRKRKREEERAWVNGQDEGGRATKAPKTKKTKTMKPRENTAVYVTGLPLDVTVEEVAEVFSKKCGVIAEEIDSGRPRIKLYTDAEGRFKGDALIVFFKAPSVQMAITLLDDTQFRFGDAGGSGNMKVVAADSSYKKTKTDELREDNTGSNGSTDSEDKAKAKERAKASARDKAKIIKKTQKLDARLADWSDDEDISTIPGTGTGFAGRKPLKTVVLKHMFTLQELEEDPAAILDIKEDIREECEKLGEVTNVVLYDLEEDGVASVKFRDEAAASECVRKMDGRSFAGMTVRAYLSEGKEPFKKSGKEKTESGDEDDV